MLPAFHITLSFLIKYKELSDLESSFLFCFPRGYIYVLVSRVSWIRTFYDTLNDPDFSM